jgi:hypothetical protein
MTIGGDVGAEAAVAVVRSREREIRLAFHDAGALDPSTARALADLGLEESRGVRRLERREVVRESSPGCYYFDEEAWLALRGTRRRMAMMVLVAIGLTALAGLYAVAGSR